MNSLMRVWMGTHDARMQIQVSVVVRTTSAADRPSTPSLYWMPNSGIQSYVSVKLNPAPPSGTKRASITSEATHVASATSSAAWRAHVPGRMATSTAPTRGRNVTMVRIGSVSISVRSRPGAGTTRP